MECRDSSLEVEVLGGAPPIVRLRGEADFHSRDQICEVFGELIDGGHQSIHADLSELLYVDSSGLSALVGCATRANHAGAVIELLGVSDRVSRLLTLCGAAAFFNADAAGVPVSGEWEARSPSQGFWHVSSFSLPAVPGAAAMARGRVSEVIRALPLSLSQGQDVMLAFGEAVANAIKHGCGSREDLRFTVKCVAGPGRLSIDIHDPGVGFDPSVLVPPMPHKLVEGGMGIYVMRELMDEVSFTFDEGTTVRMVKSMCCREAAPAALLDDKEVSLSATA